MQYLKSRVIISCSSIDRRNQYLFAFAGVGQKHDNIKQTDYNYVVILVSDFLSIGRNAVRLFSTNTTTERTH